MNFDRDDFERDNFENENLDNGYKATEEMKDEIVYDSFVVEEDFQGDGFGENNKNINNNNEKFKKFMQLSSKALVFGLVAGITFSGVNYASNRITGNYNSSIIDSIGSLSGEEEGSVDKTVPITTSTNSGSSNTNSDVASVVESVMPSIVSITSTATNQVSDFFGRVYEQESEGSGSGIIISQTDKELLIATNNHVIANSTNVEITFSDETTANATVKGADSTADLAVVSVPLSELSKETLNNIKIATLGDSDQVKAGEMAIAIGNALGYGQSVTVGYVSALNREVALEDATMTLLQTDAAINPGNSGGALLNSKGEVIGINTVKFASAEVEGMGYAIPISDAIPIITDLMNREVVPESEQAYLGIIGPVDVTEEYASRFNMPIGVYVTEVGSGTAAEQAGFKEGDIIVGFDGKTITTQKELQEKLSYKKAGETVEITVKSLQDGNYVEQVKNVTLRGK